MHIWSSPGRLPLTQGVGQWRGSPAQQCRGSAEVPLPAELQAADVLPGIAEFLTQVHSACSPDTEAVDRRAERETKPSPTVDNAHADSFCGEQGSPVQSDPAGPPCSVSRDFPGSRCIRYPRRCCPPAESTRWRFPAIGFLLQEVGRGPAEVIGI